ncbi:MAG: DUF58 domain-containing protein [Actinomycetota bacterium]|nr:MAG: DUF58 domain-containing protein [Actinomycetota bacterium]
MRAALRALTARGRVLLAAGVGLLGSAMLIGERDLLRVAVLVLALPIGCAVVVSRSRQRLACTRGLDQPRVAMGSTATVRLTIDNASRLPARLVLCQDAVPAALGPGERFVLDQVPAYGSAALDYRLRPQQRGRFAVGPLSVRLVDPFGLTRVSRSFTATDTLLVTPPVHRLPDLPLAGHLSGQGDSRAGTMSSAGHDDVIPRPYHVGDELRRVHWRSTARAGALMVRREERPWRSRAAILLDTRSSAHRGTGAQSTFEWACSAVASVGVHLIRRGWAVVVIDGDGGVLVTADRPGTEAEAGLLDALAVLQPTPSRAWRPSAAATRGAGLIVAVLGELDAVEAEQLSRLRAGSVVGLAVALRTDPADVRHAPNGADDRGAAGTASRLRRAGWQAVPASATEPVPDIWRRLVHPSIAGPSVTGPSIAGTAGPSGAGVLRQPPARSAGAPA